MGLTKTKKDWRHDCRVGPVSVLESVMEACYLQCRSSVCPGNRISRTPGLLEQSGSVFWDHLMGTDGICIIICM